MSARDFSHISCWVITEGIAGTENQCLGVAEALGITPVVKRISLNAPWNQFSPFLGFEQDWTFDPPLEPPWPDLLIASGRKSIAAARYIKRESGGKTFTVQLQDPRVSPKHFDLVAVPEHDRLRGDNVIVTTATPNRVTPEKLKDAREKFGTLIKIQEPRVAVLIGGNSKTHRLTETAMRKLAFQIRKLDAGLMITASRRTGDENRTILEELLKEADAYIWDGSGENPYFGFLAWADYIIVTSDSASMLSEAATTGKPVYMVQLEGGSPKFDRLYKNLSKAGALRNFEGILKPYSYAPLNDANIIASAIKELYPGHSGR